jgi:hypothetical protein
MFEEKRGMFILLLAIVIVIVIVAHYYIVIIVTIIVTIIVIIVGVNVAIHCHYISPTDQLGQFFLSAHTRAMVEDGTTEKHRIKFAIEDPHSKQKVSIVAKDGDSADAGDGDDDDH